MKTLDEDLGAGLTPDALADPGFYAGDPWPLYRWLRQHEPVAWSEAGQFWALTKYDDVLRVGRDPRGFSSTRGTLIPDGRNRDSGGPHMPGVTHLIRSDPPEHTELRRLVARSFTPRAVARLEVKTRQLVRELVEQIDGASTVNAVEAISAPATTFVIAELMGVPREDWSKFWRWTDSAIVQVDRSDEETERHIAELLDYFRGLCQERRRNPGEDIVTHLVEGTFRGEPLDEANLLTYCKLLLTAGTETTRTLISGGIQLLAEHPDQRQLLVEDPDRMPDAVEEMLRVVSPVIAFGRTATEDTEIRGVPISAGDYVVMLYPSANRDEDVWADSESFDIARPVERHLAFGFGPHVCLGAPLARMESRVIFEELLHRFPEYELVGDPVRRPSTLVRAVEELPVVFGTPAA